MTDRDARAQQEGPAWQLPGEYHIVNPPVTEDAAIYVTPSPQRDHDGILISPDCVFDDVMLDLETLGTLPTAPVVSVGACCFDVKSKTIGRTFYMPVRLESAQLAHASVGTLQWWLKQSEQARAVFSQPGAMTLPYVLAGFRDFLCRTGPAMRGQATDVRVWGNGADFDNAILANAYGEDQLPWRFFNSRCYRTAINLLDEARRWRIDRSAGTHHNALDDAIAQARHLIIVTHKFAAAVNGGK
jgi:hypothetical protein